MKIVKTNSSRLNGTSFHGIEFTATPNQLVAAFGPADYDGNDGSDKTNFYWDLELLEDDQKPGQGIVFTVYDWKEYRSLNMDEKVTWHIGAHSTSDSIDALDAVLEVLDDAKYVYRPNDKLVEAAKKYKAVLRPTEAKPSEVEKFLKRNGVLRGYTVIESLTGVRTGKVIFYYDVKSEVENYEEIVTAVSLMGYQVLQAEELAPYRNPKHTRPKGYVKQTLVDRMIADGNKGITYTEVIKHLLKIDRGEDYVYDRNSPDRGWFSDGFNRGNGYLMRGSGTCGIYKKDGKYFAKYYTKQEKIAYATKRLADTLQRLANYYVAESPWFTSEEYERCKKQALSSYKRSIEYTKNMKIKPNTFTYGK